jgi:hypothetical protein
MTGHAISPVPPKAPPRDFGGRFREILSDPLNLFVRRVPMAGTVADGLVTLHNGHRVALSGEASYYDLFSHVLVYNRGVHEPLEEFAFQQMLETLPPAPVMIELGAYWAHYSMWLKQARPDGRCIMVEPSEKGLEAGRVNFARHGYDGTFEQGLIGKGQVTVDDIMARHAVDRLDVLHSDIQGFEVEMLDGAEAALAEQRIDRVFVSTHGEDLHARVLARLTGHGYRIDAQSGHGDHTTGHDGLVLAVHPRLPRFLPEIGWMGRAEIARATPEELAAYVAEVAAAVRGGPERTSRQTG